jgi:predicted DNA-binding transcriptional regulator YafY
VSQTERIHQIVHLLENSRQPVPLARFLDELEISRATFKRDLEYLRDRLGAPIEWRRGGSDRPGGYVLNAGTGDATQPLSIRGIWFNQSEIYALLMMHQLATRMEPGLISTESQGLLARITQLLGRAEDDPRALLSRIQILHSATKRRPSPWFPVIARATVRRRRLQLTYYTRSRNRTSERLVSPQRLIHYRENWYLIAWCHQAGGLRLFALDATRQAQADEAVAQLVPEAEIDRLVGNGFGIFGGSATDTARLRFSPTAARWISDEIWHPDQRQTCDGEQLVLEVPFSNTRELIMEILRHGADVEVLAPETLRDELAQVLEAALQRYRQTGD